MYINFWYPICTGEELTDAEPRTVELLGVRLVVFRDSDGDAHVLSDTCVHRGGSLSNGRIVDGCVVCPYHGWRYDGSGTCVEVPQLKDKKPPARAKVDSYPVYEKYGVVFAFLGDLPEDQRPPLPVLHEDGQEGWRITGPMVFEIAGYFERSMENGMDPIHNEFVHPAQGAPSVADEDVEVSDAEWGCRFVAQFAGLTQKENLQGVVDADRSVGPRAGSWHIGPNALMTEIHVPGNNSFVQYFFEAPVNKQLTRIYFVNARNNTLNADKDDFINGTFMKIAGEDRHLIENLRPYNTPDTLSKELLLPGDSAVVRYREYLKGWQDKGWRIDWDALTRDSVDVAYAIPSPARRESKNWVLDPVPLTSAG